MDQKSKSVSLSQLGAVNPRGLLLPGLPRYQGPHSRRSAFYLVEPIAHGSVTSGRRVRLNGTAGTAMSAEPSGVRVRHLPVCSHAAVSDVIALRLGRQLPSPKKPPRVSPRHLPRILCA